MTEIIILNSTSTYLHLGSYLTMLGLKKLINSLNANIIFEHEVNNYDFSDVIEVYNRSNKPLIIVNGEGTFHDDQSFAKEILEVLDENKMSFIILNAQFRNMSDKYINIVKTSKLLQVRTQKDYNYCKGKGLENLLYCPDMLFFSGVSEINEIDVFDEILFTDSHVEKASAAIINKFLEKSKFKKKWINIHFRETCSLSFYESFKLRILHKINNKIDKLNTRKQLSVLNNLNKMNFSKTLFAFMNSKLIITGRYHAACLGILLKKPVLYTYSNTSKIKDVCMDFNWGEELNQKNYDCLFEKNSKNIEKINKENIFLMKEKYNYLKDYLNNII